MLNRKGFDRARAAGCAEIGMAIAASESFSQRNQGCSVEEGVETWLEIAEAARGAGIRAQITISTAFGCPFEGEVPPARVVALAERLAAGNPDEIAIADTIGVAVPTQVTALVGALRVSLPRMKLRAHFHNTRNTGLANAYAAIEAGVRSLDASCGGIGGCPFAPAATGNVPTEDLIYMLHRMGIDTGVDLPAVARHHPLAAADPRPRRARHGRQGRTVSGSQTDGERVILSYLRPGRTRAVRLRCITQ